MLDLMRLIHLLSSAVVTVLLLAWVGLPGEHVTTTLAKPSWPWHPDGLGTPAIDVVGKVPFAAEVFGDVAVVPRYGPRVGLAAARVTDGSPVWRYENAWSDDSVGHVRVDDRRIAAVWRDGRVTLLDVPDGRVVWRADLPDGPYHEANRAYDEEWGAAWELSLAADGSVPIVVVAHEGRIDAVDGRTGAIRWSYPPRGSAACFDGARGEGEVVMVFQRCPGPTPHVMLDAGDGRARWRFDGGEWYHARALGAGRLAWVDRSGGLNVSRAADGRLLWRVPSAGLKDNPYGTDMGVSAELVTVVADRRVTAYRIADGAVAWRRDRVGGDSAVLTDGTYTYVAEDATTLLKLDARTGRVVDRHRFEADITLEWLRGGLAGINVGVGDDVVVG
ncbi:PQQ-binding-like beta-propeller repeat protein [Nonomuraea sp. FMUSA5-5]|uniref:PQQ-binding-like beta-propeller repeat protein n=1 Tax=Nonomuraea composti TaxID=2720023 RepID=A0ABX1BAE1_9ACTN|nr:PQQ-binding-like beta-propeller repeat protein [Nonomuraea sp. FMUSA5-5]NJP92734.1 PQQ-binding-like beta-propeller repeat protein [Nonomuraea sp. FMUSA5-5]